MEKKKRGGKREGAGRGKGNNPTTAFTFYVKRSDILNFGSPDKFKQRVKELIENEGLNTKIEYSAATLESYDGLKLNKVIQDEPPMFQSVPFNQEADFMERAKEAKNMDELKKIVQEVEKSGLTFFPKKRIKEYAEKLGENFYQD